MRRKPPIIGLAMALALALAAATASAQTQQRYNRWGLPTPDVRVQQMPDLVPRAPIPDPIPRQSVAPQPRPATPAGSVGFVNRTRDRVTLYVGVGRETPLTLAPGASEVVACGAACDSGYALVLTAAPTGQVERRVELKSGASFVVLAIGGIYTLARE